MKLFLNLILIILNYSLYATNYYVSATGNDNNDGLSSTTPFQTIQKAADLTSAGDVVYIMNGTYTNTFTWEDLVYINRGGTQGNPITYTNYDGHQPKLSFNGWHGIKIEGGIGYIEIIGLEIEGNNSNINLNDALNQPAGCNDPSGSPDGFYNGNGIASDDRFNGQNHHITIRDCKVYNCAGVGISAIHTDYVTIENCEIYNNAWYSIYGTSGISFYQLWNFDNSTGFRNIIRNNLVYNNKMLVPWIDAPCAITDGNGIIVDDGRNTQNGSTNGIYNGRTLIENNIVYNNGGRGIHIFESDKVDVLNNTVYNNGESIEISDGEITAIFVDDVKVFNNILYARNGERINSTNGTNISYDFNLNYNSNLYSQTGSNSLLGQAPMFSNLSNFDFSLMPSSPAINSGNSNAGCYAETDILNIMRPIGSAPDIGSYEYLPPLAVEYLQPLSAKYSPEGISLEWSTTQEIENSYFDIFHASDLGDFQKIGHHKVIEGQDNIKRYYFLHTSPAEGNNNYYIQQFDLDGSSSNSNIVSIFFESSISIFPNPATDQIQIVHNLEEGYYHLLTTSGSLVKKGNINDRELNIRDLPKGIYFLQIYSKHHTILLREKIVVNDKR